MSAGEVHSGDSANPCITQSKKSKQGLLYSPLCTLLADTVLSFVLEIAVFYTVKPRQIKSWKTVVRSACICFSIRDLSHTVVLASNIYRRKKVYSSSAMPRE